MMSMFNEDIDALSRRVGANLNNIMAKKGMSAKRLAPLVGVSYPTIKNIRNGNMGGRSKLWILLSIANILDVELDDLIC